MDSLPCIQLTPGNAQHIGARGEQQDAFGFPTGPSRRRSSRRRRGAGRGRAVRRRWPWAGVVVALLAAAPTAAEPPVEAMEASTVRVLCLEGERMDSGSGFVIGRGRHVATAQHLLDCTTRGGGMFVYVEALGQVPARVVWADRERDLAVLALERPLGRPAVRFAPRGPLRVAQTVYALGFPRSAAILAATGGRDARAPGRRVNDYIRSTAMPMTRCPMGHYYDSDKHSSCPACGMAGVELDVTRGRPAAGAVAPGAAAAPAKTVARGRGRAAEGVTIGMARKRLGIDPVVGWLVCTHGADRGRDYRIRSERNFIGRSAKMDIPIQGDETISRENHAIVSFNPKNNRFKLLPGEGRGLVYLNDEEVDMPVALHAYDVIELGQTRLLFVPFCGERFHWQGGAEGGDKG